MGFTSELSKQDLRGFSYACLGLYWSIVIGIIQKGEPSDKTLASQYNESFHSTRYLHFVHTNLHKRNRQLCLISDLVSHQWSATFWGAVNSMAQIAYIWPNLLARVFPERNVSRAYVFLCWTKHSSSFTSEWVQHRSSMSLALPWPPLKVTILRRLLSYQCDWI